MSRLEELLQFWKKKYQVKIISGLFKRFFGFFVIIFGNSYLHVINTLIQIITDLFILYIYMAYIKLVYYLFYSFEWRENEIAIRDISRYLWKKDKVQAQRKEKPIMWNVKDLSNGAKMVPTLQEKVTAVAKTNQGRTCWGICVLACNGWTTTKHKYSNIVDRTWFFINQSTST